MSLTRKIKRNQYKNNFVELKKAYKKGFNDGIEHAIEFFKRKFDGIYEVPGIGEKTVEKIVKHFGEEFFEKQE